jgi:uncharacterized protein YggU (UPF0235/DUF167 family)
MNVPYRSTRHGVELFARVTAKSSCNSVIGLYSDSAGRCYLNIKTTEVAENGKANAAVICILSDFFHLPKNNITQKMGETHRLKSFILDGIGEEEMLSKINLIL